MKKIMTLLVLLILLLTACAPARKPLPPLTPPGKEQRPRPIPAPKNISDQIVIDDFISGATRDIPGVKSVSTLVVGNVALVGVTFENNVSTERQKAARREISDKILTLNGITDTLITSDPDKIKKIEKVSQQMRRGQSLADSWDDIDKLMKSLHK